MHQPRRLHPNGIREEKFERSGQGRLDRKATGVTAGEQTIIEFRIYTLVCDLSL